MAIKPPRRHRKAKIALSILGVILLILGAFFARALYHVKLPNTALTAAQQAEPYAKYFNRPLTAPSAQLEAAVAKPINCDTDALPINDINKLLDPGYQKVETGYCVFKDGGGYASANIKMPGVTLAMFNWWFIWHSQDPLRYKMWDKDDHFDVQISDATRKRYNDTSLPMNERLWGTTNTVRENIGIPMAFRLLEGAQGKDPYAITINFISPKDCGFDMSKFDFSKETVVCADSGMRHYVRQTADGVELRSRFYAGYVKKNGVFVRDSSSAAPLGIEAGLNHHMIKEFTNLASFLPELYAEQGPKGPTIQ